ncbi:MAG: aminodeoxychorismate/anthranilate synthase component II [Fulvivirga sp.]|uniref:anthranilate synthase component II n=1 Tax=Fulvivirga sp. TaxID=1931237 RepID=UPI0032F0600A
MRILVLDNYDSFVYNLVHGVRELGYGNDLTVVRNDKITLEEVDQFDKILLSPGPGIPDEAGIMKELIKKYGSTKSILGICLGHQAIAEVYGAELYNMKEVLHGIEGELVEHDDEIFDGMPASFKIGHYHSWVVKEATISSPLKITAKDKSGLVMGISHEQNDVKGLQFHPESILTVGGMRIIENWLGQNNPLLGGARGGHEAIKSHP